MADTLLQQNGEFYRKKMLNSEASKKNARFYNCGTAGSIDLIEMHRVVPIF